VPTFAVRATRFVRLAAVVLVVPGCLLATANAQKKSAPAPKVSAPAKAPSSSVKPGGASTAGHTTTTTAGHTTTTTAGRTTTTTGGRTTTTAGGRTTTTTSRTTTSTGPGGRTSSTTVSRTTTTGGRLPAGSHTVAGPHGTEMTRRADGRPAEFHDSGRGMTVHHDLHGGREVRVERADHSRVYGERGGRGYVQHPYMYHGREFGHRTYWDHGHYHDAYYRRYGYHGAFLDVYAPRYYFGPAYYGWAYNPWAVPVAYGWGWGAAPWYGYYGGYFAPYPVYPSAAFWLTDYMIAASLQDAYAAQAAAAQQAAAGQAAADQAAALTPEVKAMVAEEVKRQLALENAEAAQNASNQDIDPASSGISRMLSDGQPHVFITGASLDLVDAAGTECAVSQGDIIEVAAAPAPDATAATAVVLASKGASECRKSDTVTVAFTDLQDMQNHMRENIDQGLGDLQKKQGQGGLPKAPPSAQAAPTQAAFAAGAPGPDTTAGDQIADQTKAADQDEQAATASATGPAVGGGVAVPAPIAAPAGPPPTIAVGQTIDQVTASMGQPTRIIDLGVKKIYVYKDMKVTFKSGKVSDVE
jgi:hypothetical protein